MGTSAAKPEATKRIWEGWQPANNEQAEADSWSKRYDFKTMCLDLASRSNINIGEIDSDMFQNAKRVLITTDMSTECDDECALLWILGALNRRKIVTTIELLMSDSQVRYQWMAYLFHEKLKKGGEWKVSCGGSSIQVGVVLVNCFLAYDPVHESGVIASIQTKAPEVKLDLEEIEDGPKKRTTAVRKFGSLGGEEVNDMRPGHLDAIIIAGPIPAMATDFFDRFTSVGYTYVVGTPGGVNCPQPSWSQLLSKFHKLGPVLYLTPQFTRGVRFPRAYVMKNQVWNNFLKRTIFDSTLMCMAKRPEIPAKFGNWGLVLRLNVANALFCKDWYFDAIGSPIEQAKRPEHVVQMVQAYVDRNSGDDRQPGAVITELKLLGVDTSDVELNAAGQPATSTGKEKIRTLYREHLFEHTFICVLTTYILIWQNDKNWGIRKGMEGFKTFEPKCGYVAPYSNLVDVFGDEFALRLVQQLPLRNLTPAYDVVAMICAVSSLETGKLDELGLEIEDADESMGKAIMTEESWNSSKHKVCMVAHQNEDAINCQVKELTACV